jgi:hypothetical protein
MPLQATSGAASYDAFGGGAAVEPNYIESVFSTFLYTGTGADQTITNGIDLSGKGGLVWIKARTSRANYLFDTTRGAGKWLVSNETGAQETVATSLSSFNADGFSLGSTLSTNFTNEGMCSWTFREQAKFFDIVTWTGNGTDGRSIPHNLGSTPGSIIVKCTNTNATDWFVWHRSIANNGLLLNSTSAAQSYYWSPTDTPTSTNILVSGSYGTNVNGETYVAYLFAHNAGGFGLTGTDNVISCGSFTANGSGDATVNLGYEPQWVLTKRSSGTGNWVIQDIMRGMPVQLYAGVGLYPNTSNAESAAYTSGANLLPTATGFVADNSSLVPSETYIYIAIRRGPMKVPTTGTSVFQAALRTGTGAAATVTGINFPPDLSILGNRTIVNTRNFWDRLRGVGRYLGPHTVGAEENNATTVTSFNMNGISLGSDATNTANYTGSTFVNYYFRRAPGFFDEVCYTGNSTARTVAHNLAAVPELMIVKNRSSGALWLVYSSATGPDYYSVLNTTAARAQDTAVWNNTAPTASVFSLGNSWIEANRSGETYVNYLFATCPGVSKVGSYTGNGTTQAIACGFTGGARFVLIKRTDDTGDWYVYDTARGMTTLTDPYLFFNSAVAETATLGSVTTTTGGFTVNAAILAAINTNTASYIFLAIS